MKVKIYQDSVFDGLQVLLYETTNVENEFFVIQGEYKKVKHKEWEPIRESTLRISSRDSKEFLDGLASSLKQLGYKFETDITGELSATKYHLEDMRKLAMERRK